MRIAEVVAGSDLYAAVLRLWRAESATLGYMPDGGFEDAARDRCLFAAIADGDQAAGYVMFRRARDRVVIVHLCVEHSRRGKGIARILFEAVRAACTDCHEIRLRCRRDFSADALWPRLGFVPVADEAGRGRHPAELTVWRYEISALPILRRLAEQTRPSMAVRAVLDANVFFDLDDRTTAGVAVESRGLLADWIGEFVELAVTQEMYNEIHRNDAVGERKYQRGRLQGFTIVERDAERADGIAAMLREFLSLDDKPSAHSDLRHLANTIAAGLSVFVTRDEELLDAGDALYDRFGLRVLSPLGLIRHIDELPREEEYRPRRLVGPGVTVRAVKESDIDVLVDTFHAGQTAPERHRDTKRRLRDALADPSRFTAECVHVEGHLLAAYLLERPDPQRLVVPFFAVATSSLGCTAARHFGESIVAIAAAEQRAIVQVADAGPRVSEALEELGFSWEDEAWFKLGPRVVGNAEAIASALEKMTAGGVANSLARRWVNELREPSSAGASTSSRAADIERALWPAKLIDAGTPCFVVPIKPHWAQELFDREVARETLFGANPALAFSRENAYFRSPSPRVIRAPGRVLWYVSDQDGYPRSMALRACSRVEEVDVGDAKDLFRRYRRLGVYDWANVDATASDGQVQAFRFAQTELFPHPIPWDELQGTLKRHTGKGNQVQGPFAIPEACFIELYARGVGDDE